MDECEAVDTFDTEERLEESITEYLIFDRLIGKHSEDRTQSLPSSLNGISEGFFECFFDCLLSRIPRIEEVSNRLIDSSLILWKPRYNIHSFD